MAKLLAIIALLAATVGCVTTSQVVIRTDLPQGGQIDYTATIQH